MASFSRDMLASGMSAAIAKTLIAPIERVKLLLQLQATSTQITHERRYKGIVDCLRRIPVEQGMHSFWRGNLANVCRYFAVQAFNFAFKDAYKAQLAPVTPDSFWRLLASNLASGAAAGVSSILLTYPLDFARTRLSTDVARDEFRQYRGIVHCLRSVVQRDGVRGVYRGLVLSLPTVIIYRATYFGVFDTAKVLLPAMSADRRSSNLLLTWGLAQSSTTAAGLLCYPMDTVRRRLVMQSGRPQSQRHYSSAADCCKKMFHGEGGLRAFYKGALTNVLRGAGSAVVLVLYDEIRIFL